MKLRCGCCEGVEPLTPGSIENRPGLSAITYRVGTHATFFETMVAALSTTRVSPEPGAGDLDRPPLADLTTREPSDPTIALLDAWATVGDVLTFYQERIANEAYLRTATERRSVTELARLVGYAPRPGVAANVFLAYTLDKDYEAVIPAGTRAQSVPKPGEQAESFETSEPLFARWSWSVLKPRMRRPQVIGKPITVLYLAGIQNNLHKNDVLVIVQSSPEAYVIVDVEVDGVEGWTRVAVKPFGWKYVTPEPGNSQNAPPNDAFGEAKKDLVEEFDDATVAPSDATALGRNLEGSFQATSDATLAVLTELVPELRGGLYQALSATPDKLAPDVGVYVMRAKAAAFGHNAPLRQELKMDDNGKLLPPEFKEWDPHFASMAEASDPTGKPAPNLVESNAGIFLDGTYDGIVPGSYVFLANRLKGNTKKGYSKAKKLIRKVVTASTGPRTAYAISAKTTHLTLSGDWWQLQPNKVYPINKEELDTIAPLRSLQVYAQSERLSLAEEPIVDAVAGSKVELDAIYGGLQAGRWVIVRGERDDVPGLYASELLMIAGIVQQSQSKVAGDTMHTTLVFANKLAHSYVRSTVTIYANVVHATHGETKHEILGSGDAGKALQSFNLRQAPLTHVSAATATGTASSLQVRVDGVLWPEAPSLAFLGPRDRQVATRADEMSKVTVMTGDGVRGARLPTGVENVTATYRTGIGLGGNVAADQVSLLITRPLGVKQVINPMPATGGAERETRDQVRDNAPLAVMALDRLVSVRDYADFARTFAGIGKAESVRTVLSGGQFGIKLAIAGAGNTPINPTSDVYKNLLQALHKYGEPNEPVELVVHVPLLLILSASVRVADGYEWKQVEPRVRATVLDAFGFEKRRLGQPAFLSAIVGLLQSVKGVAYVDVDTFGSLREDTGFGSFKVGDQDQDGPREYVEAKVKDLVEGKDQPTPMVDVLFPAEIAYFTPAVPDTLILTELSQ
jgi:predicted phage baseplate assembly protein